MKLLLITVLLCGFLEFSFGCPSKFKPSAEEEYTNATIYCMTKLGLAPENLPPAEELNRNAELDDKCMSKCILEKFEAVDKDGLLDRDVLFDFLEDSAPKTLLTKLTEIVNKCADTTEIDKVEKSKEESKVQMVIPCQTYHAFQVCFKTNAEKLC